jgi:hypothetical protein
MSDPIDLPLDSDDRLYDPPLVDSIYFDERKRGFAILFMPSDDVSSSLKEFVFIGEASEDYPRVSSFWQRIGELLSPGGQVERVVHCGGGNFIFHFADESYRELATLPDEAGRTEISDRLKQIADAAQIAFVDESYAAPGRS